MNIRFQDELFLSSTLPLTIQVLGNNSQLLTQILKMGLGSAFVRMSVFWFSLSMCWMSVFPSYLFFTNKVEPHINVLHRIVELWILAEVNCSHVSHEEFRLLLHFRDFSK
ncbi:hypothetical protein T11_18360 [Trichinella zimbabwensis]|uniref:Uncharacterized protein n=1 Tax=Trichinella zimbabwensis TaxID=268475 RepID=A0A0V1HTF4_9BILA|nr:hypothetical protein T11_18360 [Trichinella zimbabwensis]